MEFDYIIIGAGAAGLSFAALMEKRGYKIAILEAHSLPGGCSSYFERDGFTFDAGATTLSGLKEGRPLHRLITELDLKLELISIDPGIVFIIGDKKISRYRDPERWIEELTKKFKGINHRKLWSKLKQIETRGWMLSTTFKNIPLRSLKSLLSFFSVKLPLALISAPELFRSVESELQKFHIKDQSYLNMLDELLFITAQNNRQETPLLMGAMGLCYPEDTSYAIGGMKAFSNALAAKCSTIFYRHQVQKITPIKNGLDGFTIHTVQGVFKTKKLVSTIPHWNIPDLFEDKKVKDFFSSKKTFAPKDCWSAFMIYLTVPLNCATESLYYQIHCEGIPFCSTKSFFVSLSHPADSTRSIKGRQTVTISTHTKSSEWLGLDNVEYKNKKEITANFILSVLKEKFKLQENDLQNIVTGTPRTFIKYTKRYLGLVGGIPHSLKRNPLDYIIARPLYKNFYMLGDTQFPGQGIAAVVLGSMNLVDYLDK
ncbi:MAG: FAD-dependent oxidoreductase [Bacteriovorax sp.]|nr:FAD-dependent oxidoreductase [Bacteriovorax sp.]